MKKERISAYISRFATPVALILLGLVLLLCPDAASALISTIVGWCLMLGGIITAVAIIADSNWSVAKVLTVLVLILMGRWLINHPLAWAAWGGRIVGVLLLLRGIRDFRMSCLSQGKALSAVAALLGLVLIFLPMTASRLVFALCGGAILLCGGGMLVERIWEGKHPEGDDPNIIDAL